MTKPQSTNDLIDRAAALVEAAQKAGADKADAGVGSGHSLAVDVRGGKVEEIQRSESDGFFLRVFVGKRTASISANDVSAVDMLAERAVAMAKVAPEDDFAGFPDKDLLAKDFPDLDLLDETEISSNELEEKAKTVEEAVLAHDGSLKAEGASASWGLGGSVLVTSDGFQGGYRTSNFSCSVSAIAGEGTAMERDYDYDSKRHLEDLQSPEIIGKSAAERVLKRVNPQKVDTQTAAVVYDPRVAIGLLGHLGSAINGAAIARGTSFLKDKMGEQILPAGTRISDDPFRKRGAGSRPFDGEGVAAQSLDVVSDGVLNTWMLDSATGRELNLPTNGRASRSGSGTSPGRTNFTLHEGEKTPQDVMQELGKGLYVIELIGSGVSMITGDYSRGAAGFWFENGEIQFPVAEVTVAGNLNDMFRRLIICNDLKYRFATNAPTLAVDGMTIAGR